jgi:hypothetical protein
MREIEEYDEEEGRKKLGREKSSNTDGGSSSSTKYAMYRREMFRDLLVNCPETVEIQKWVCN